MAGALELVEALPDKFSTVLGPDGETLSLGQRRWSEWSPHRRALEAFEARDRQCFDEVVVVVW